MTLSRRAFVVYLCVAISLAFVDHRVRRFPDHVVKEYIPSVVNGTAEAPGRYRVLAPFAIDAITRTLAWPPLPAYLFIRLVLIWISLLSLDRYLRHWFEPNVALAGTLAAAAWLPLTFTNSWSHPDTFVELPLFTIGCLLVARRQDVVFACVLVIALLNRETAGFLVLLWACCRLAEDRSIRTLSTLAAYGALVVLVYAGLRWLRGFEHYRYWMLPENLATLKLLPEGFDPYTRIAGYFFVPLVLIPGWFAASGARTPGAPVFFTCTLVVASAFVIVAFLIAATIETRVFTPMIPLLLPGAVRFFTLREPATPLMV